jgi:hypothetical protein
MMSGGTFRIVLTGTLKDGHRKLAVKERLAKLLKLDPTSAEALLSGRERTLKRGLMREQLDQYQSALERTGAEFRIEEEQDDLALGLTMEDASPEPQRAPQVVAPRRCPKCSYAATAGDDLLLKGECPACGIVVPKYLERLSAESSAPAATSPTPGRPPAGEHPAAPARGTSAQGTAIPSQEQLESKPRITIYETTPSSEWAVYWRCSLFFTLVAVAVIAFETLIAPVFSHPADGSVPLLTFSRKLGVAFITEGTVTAHVVYLMFIGLGVLAMAFAMFYSCYIYKYRRGLVLYYALFSGGGILLGAFLGYLIQLLFQGIHKLAEQLELDGRVGFKKACGVLALVIVLMPYGSELLRQKHYPGHPLDLGMATEVAEASGSGHLGATLVERLELAQKELGGDFPMVGETEQFRYYQAAYVKPATAVTGDFNRALNLHRSAFLESGFHRPKSERLELLVFNAACFRDRLAAEEIITPVIKNWLNELAFEWGRVAVGQQPGPGRSIADIRRAEFDSHCPIRKSQDLAVPVAGKETSAEVLEASRPSARRIVEKQKGSGTP